MSASVPVCEALVAGSQPQPAIRLSDVTKRFSGSTGAQYTAVEQITLDLPRGAFLSIVGPSGCGKSTILNMAAGLLRPTEGSIRIFGEPLTGINRRASYMFQQDALLPWKTVLDNICLGLTFRGEDRQRALDLAQEWVKRTNLGGFEHSYPCQLSGGMRKRVAMAQNWIVDPDIVLMDEPFGALDVHTRLRMETEILDLWADSGRTVLFITHDLEEAIGMSDEVVVLSAGPASRIVGRYRVDLPRPRNLIDIKTDPRFIAVYSSVWSDLREEVLKSHEPRKTI
jgi:NitT/TauT family transport system ATP-binding protein